MKPKLIIFGDPKRKFAEEAVSKFVKSTKDKVEILGNCFGSSCSIDILKNADYAVVFGGDGTILSAARDLSQANVPVIGVNVGRLGFLAEFSVDEVIRFIDNIIDGQMRIERRMIIKSCIKQGKDQRSSTAVNEMVIAAGAPFNMIELKIKVDGQALAGCVGDGVIISTPTGSTAYNLSAGGPILCGDLSAIVITPLCPHSLSFRPIVISSESVIEVEVVRVNEGTTITLDGQVSHKLCKGDVVNVEKDEGAFLVVNNPLRTQWDTLAGKLNWAEKPKYKNEESNK